MLTHLSNTSTAINEISKYAGYSLKVWDKISSSLSYTSTAYDTYIWINDPSIENYQNVVTDIAGFMHPIAGVVMNGYFKIVNRYMNQPITEVYFSDSIY